MAEKKNTFHLEEAFESLEDIISKLEDESISLKDSIDLYGKGAKLLSKCKEELNGIEKEMIIIGEGLEQGEEKAYGD
ncbi:MAG: exodeoxyribonuclease VII small subunit [Lachnospiraceae bacterium]|nr:exodeoxyribonuclease VII small subunit [Lachnospiraceae bacterium]